MASNDFRMGGQTGCSSTLIVNNMPGYFTEEELKSMFTMFGNVKSVRISRNHSDNRSLGYGFVEYSDNSDAKKAIENVDGLQLGKKKLRVAFSEPADETIKQATKVIVKQIPVKYDEAQLKAMFAAFGRIVKVRLIRDSVTNRSTRVGLVFFEKWADAQKAVNDLNDHLPENAKDKLKVSIDKPGKHMQWTQWEKASDPGPSIQMRGPHPYGGIRSNTQTQPAQGRKIQSVISTGPGPACVFLYNISEYVTEQEIYNLFAQFGGLKKIDIVRDMNTQLCKGYAFLSFDSYQAAESSIFAMDRKFYRGRQLQVRFKYN